MFASWTIHRRVRAVTVCSLLVAVTGLGVAGLKVNELATSLDQIVITTEALRAFLHADMMHDALRGDVHAAMLARSEKERADVSQQIGEHGQLFLDDLKKVKSLPLSSELKRNIAGVDGELQRYLESARSMEWASHGGVDAALEKLPAFQERFEALEGKNDIVSEQIQKAATQARGDAYALVAYTG